MKKHDAGDEMKPELEKLSELKAAVKEMPSLKGKAALIKSLSSSMSFLTRFKVGGRNARLIVASRESEYQALESILESKKKKEPQHPLNL